ncbi:hypothetical protein OROGR_030315 [Orobanche gracilis]
MGMAAIIRDSSGAWVTGVSLSGGTGGALWQKSWPSTRVYNKRGTNGFDMLFSILIACCWCKFSKEVLLQKPFGKRRLLRG